MFKRETFSMIMAAGMAISLLAGCSQSSNGNGAAGSESSQPPAAPSASSEGSNSKGEQVKLTYISWDPVFEKQTRELLDRFTETHPNIKVDLQTYDTSTYWTKVSAMAASDQAPDIMDMSSGYIDDWAGKGLLTNLQPYIDQDIDNNQYYTGLYDAVRYPDKKEGDMYAFPVNFVTTVLYYNQALFDEAGLGYPNDKWTWDDFLAAAKKLTKDTDGDGTTDQWGFFLYGRYAQIEPWIYQNNGDILTNNKTVFEVNENGREALQFLSDLTNVHKVSPTPKSVADQKDKMFQSGKVAMWVDGSFKIENLRQDIGDKFAWNISAIPAGPKSTGPVTYGWPDNIAITAKTKHPKEAWELVKFMIGSERSADQFVGGKVPAYKPTAESEAWLEKGLLPANKGLILQQGEHLGPNSYTKSWSEWRGYGAAAGTGLNGELDQVFDGEKSLEEAIQSVTKFANGILSR